MTNNNMIIKDVAVTGEEVREVIDKVESVLDNVRREHVVVACLEIAMIAMNPMLTVEELHAGVRDCSRWLSLYVTGIGEEIPKEKIN